jgi:formylglycine-generating enzyme required for sulfatase activity
MTDASHTNAAFYCPVHQIRFHTAVVEVIQCDRNAHALGAGFPHQSWWTYCCDCATFSPYEPVNGNKGLRECFVCERQITRRYLCNKCRVMSLESNALVRRKLYSIDRTAVRPNCPGCGLPASNSAVEHECAEVRAGFLTAASICAFCDIEIAASQIQDDKSAGRIFCGGCETELLATFKFCKRCGKPKPQSIPQIELVNLPVPDGLATSISDPDITDGEFADYDEDEFGNEFDEVETSDLTDADDESSFDEPGNLDIANEVANLNADESYSTAETTLLNRPWDDLQPEVPRKRRNPWVIGGGVALLAIGILVTVVSIGSRSPIPSPKPSPPVLPTHPGMIYVAGGEFTMGSDTGDEYERPAHKVKVASFYIDVNEVTCEDYLKFVKEKGHRLPLSWTNGSYPPGAAKQPVTGVDWYDATAYAEWLGKRLPTEEEWEFAARGVNGSKYPWGNDWRANAANAGESSPQRLTDVGSYPQGKTSAGLMDLIGNAWEWTSSNVVAYPGGHFSEPVPKGVKVIRGGSWQENKQQATATYRGFLQMSGADDYSATSFRCVKAADGPTPFSTDRATSQ